MSRHTSDSRDRIFLIAIILLIAAAVIIAAVIAISVSRARNGEIAPPSAVSEGTPSPLVIDSGYEATPAPSVTPMDTPVPAATPEAYDYLPTYNSVSTTERVIAITLDDLSDHAQFRNAVEAAARYGAKLTLFPYGYALSNSDTASALSYCVRSLGFQVENRTMNNRLLYQLEGTLMAQEIWLAEEAAEDALGGDYTMHLLRTRSNLGTTDPRTNDYLKKLGYTGFAGWNVNGNGTSLERLYDALKPGAIYYFTTQANDVANMIQLMRYANSRNYRMVTMNELLGLGANTLSDGRSVESMPLPDEYTLRRMIFQLGSRAWQVYLIQQRLIDLGYLDGQADGIYGDSTASAVMLFQANAGIICTGIASLETQDLLFRADTPVSAGATPVPRETGDPMVPFLPVNTGPIENVTRPPVLTPTAPASVAPAVTVPNAAENTFQATIAPVELTTEAPPATPDPLDIAMGWATRAPGSEAQRTPSPASLSTGVPLPEQTRAPQAQATQAPQAQATQAPRQTVPGPAEETNAPASQTTNGIPMLTAAP